MAKKTWQSDAQRALSEGFDALGTSLGATSRGRAAAAAAAASDTNIARTLVEWRDGPTAWRSLCAQVIEEVGDGATPTMDHAQARYPNSDLWLASRFVDVRQIVLTSLLARAHETAIHRAWGDARDTLAPPPGIAVAACFSWSGAARGPVAVHDHPAPAKKDAPHSWRLLYDAEVPGVGRRRMCIEPLASLLYRLYGVSRRRDA